MKKLFLLSFLILAIVAVILRFYRVDEYIMFLSDQGRDAIVLKRLITFEKLVFVGPTTSIGNVFTGPFYYYLVAPFLLVTRLDPVGPAYGVALINSLGLIGISWYVSRRYGRIAGLLFLILSGLSATQILQSRYSWNPNPVPVFTMFTLIAWERAQESRKLRWYALAGLLWGFCMQLHYITLVLLVPVAFSLLSALIARMRKKLPQFTLPQLLKSGQMRGLLLFVGGFIITFTPLILFEVKNKFITFQTFLRALSTTEVQAKQVPYVDRLVETLAGLAQHSFLVNPSTLYTWGTLVLCVFLVTVATKLYGKRKGHMLILWAVITVFANILMLSRLEVGRHVHYFHPSSLTLYLLIAFSIATFFNTIKPVRLKAVFAIVCFVGTLIFIRSQLVSLSFLFDEPRTYTQTMHAKEVAQYIISQTKSVDFQVIGLPFFETEGHYRYYLEYLGRRPMPSDTLGDPKELFVICHELAKPDCDIPGNPQWQLADFQNRHKDWKIVSEKLVGDVRVYKLVY